MPLHGQIVDQIFNDIAEAIRKSGIYASNIFGFGEISKSHLQAKILDKMFCSAINQAIIAFEEGRLRK